MNDYASETDSEYTNYWKDWFINSRGNEYFCDVDEDYLTDRFNLTGLNVEVQYYQYALDLITDVFDLDCDDDVREQIEKSARHLYGLVHARYIATNRGLQKMMEKYKIGDFGKCPRVACYGQHLLPTGQHDIANISAVKLYCARCEDLYNPKSPRHSAIDGAYFGTSFPHILFQVYPQTIPERTSQRYEPRIYGFRVHAAAALARWQSDWKEDMKMRVNYAGHEHGFEDEIDEDDDDYVPLPPFDAAANKRDVPPAKRGEPGSRAGAGVGGGGGGGGEEDEEEEEDNVEAFEGGRQAHGQSKGSTGSALADAK